MVSLKIMLSQGLLKFNKIFVFHLLVATLWGASVQASIRDVRASQPQVNSESEKNQLELKRLIIRLLKAIMVPDVELGAEVKNTFFRQKDFILKLYDDPYLLDEVKVILRGSTPVRSELSDSIERLKEVLEEMKAYDQRRQFFMKYSGIGWLLKRQNHHLVLDTLTENHCKEMGLYLRELIRKYDFSRESFLQDFQ